MTTPPGPSSSTGPTALAAPLLRRRDDRVFRGVCASVARATGTDPVLWRVALVLLVASGGAGIALYLLGWLLIPEEGQPEPAPTRWLRQQAVSRDALLGLVVGGAVVLALAGHLGGDGIVPVLVVGLLGYVVLRRPPAGAGGLVDAQAGGATLAQGAPAQPFPTGAAGEPEVHGQPGEDGQPYEPDALQPDALQPDLTYPQGGSVALTAARPWRRRPRVTTATLTAVVLVTGLVLALHAAGVGRLTLQSLLTADLAVLAVGTVVGLVAGARLVVGLVLVPLSLLVGAALLAGLTLTTPVQLSAGDRVWHVTGTGTSRLGMGTAELDLRSLAGTSSPARVRAGVDVGRLVVLVPAGLHVQLDGRVRTGQVRLPGETEAPVRYDTRLARSYGAADAPVVHVDARVGAGLLEVRTTG